jgi:hypothetical protein
MEYIIIGTGNISKTIQNLLKRKNISFSVYTSKLDNSENIYYDKNHPINIEDKVVFLTAKKEFLQDISLSVTGSSKIMVSTLFYSNIEDIKQSLQSSNYLNIIPSYMTISLENVITPIMIEKSSETLFEFLHIDKVIGEFLLFENSIDYWNSGISTSILPAILSKISTELNGTSNNLIDSGINSFNHLKNIGLKENEIINCISTKKGVTEQILKQIKIKNIY